MEKRYELKFHDTLHIQHEEQLQIVIQPRAKGNLLIYLDPEAKDVQVQLLVKESANAKIFVQNKASQEVKFTVQAQMEENANCTMAILDLEQTPMEFKQKVNLAQQGANFELYTAQLCGDQSHKVSDIEILHETSNTTGIMHNYAVLFNEAYYEMVANGNIEKNCAQAQSHQETRVLTLGKDFKTKVIPLLLIDENDVKASHALTIGQPDENQLYYLQSRGLTTGQAMGLLSVGYFMPVIQLVEDETIRQQLEDEMERRVGIYGN